MPKTNKENTATDKITEIAQQAGVILMSAAVTMGMLELPDHQNSKIVLPNQPALEVAGEHTNETNNPIRREREEAAPHFISYSEVQRTPSRSGR